MSKVELYTVQIDYAIAYSVAAHIQTARQPFNEFCKAIDKAGFYYEDMNGTVVHIPAHRIYSIKKVSALTAQLVEAGE